MNRFTFNRGEWQDGSPLPEWKDNEDIKDYLQRIGHATSKTMFGNAFVNEIEIYESSTRNSFYAHVSPLGDSFYEVFLPDFPSLMIFIKDYAGVFSAASSNTTQQEVLELLEKSFQAEHGHSASSICPQCDPVGWEANCRRNEERRNNQ